MDSIALLEGSQLFKQLSQKNGSSTPLLSHPFPALSVAAEEIMSCKRVLIHRRLLCLSDLGAVGWLERWWW